MALRCQKKHFEVSPKEIWVGLFRGDSKMLNSYISKELNYILRQINGWKAYDRGSGKLRFGKLYGYQRAFVVENEYVC